MSLVALDTIKQHMKVEGNEEDALIGIYQTAAENGVASYVNRNLYESVDDIAEDDTTGLAINGPIQAAIMIFTAFLYENRDEGAAEIPGVVRYLVGPYRIGMGV